MLLVFSSSASRRTPSRLHTHTHTHSNAYTVAIPTPPGSVSATSVQFRRVEGHNCPGCTQVGVLMMAAVGVGDGLAPIIGMHGNMRYQLLGAQKVP